MNSIVTKARRIVVRMARDTGAWMWRTALGFAKFAAILAIIATVAGWWFHDSLAPLSERLSAATTTQKFVPETKVERLQKERDQTAETVEKMRAGELAGGDLPYFLGQLRQKDAALAAAKDDAQHPERALQVAVDKAQAALDRMAKEREALTKTPDGVTSWNEGIIRGAEKQREYAVRLGRPTTAIDAQIADAKAKTEVERAKFAEQRAERLRVMDDRITEAQHVLDDTAEALAAVVARQQVLR